MDELGALTVARGIITAFGIGYLSVAYYSPKWFYKNMSYHLAFRPTSHHLMERGWISGFFVSLIIAILVGSVVFAVISPFVNAIPDSWGYANEDGDWISISLAISTLATTIATGLIAFRLEQRGREAFYNN